MQGHRSHRLAVAPMMDWTDRHCRYFLRLVSRRVRLYTEMLTTGAVLHGDRGRLLAFDPAEHPVALQLGGADPEALARAAEIGARLGYDEINLNVGCPSDRVQSGRFGACLMAEPATVAAGIAAMQRAVDIPVTVKSRIGIDEQEGFEPLRGFVETVAAAGCRIFVVHARKAWLQGLSPKQNREVPPLRHELVHRLKAEFPELRIVLNGGVATLDQAERHLGHVDGVMLGRAAYQNPMVLAEADRRLFDPAAPVPDRPGIVAAMLPYIEAELAGGTPLAAITRHMLGLYQGVPGARAWRRHLSETAHRPGAGAEVVREALRLAEAERQRLADRAAA